MKRLPSDWSPKKGDIVEVTALDHVAHADEAYLFMTWGRLHKITRKEVVIHSWAPADPKVHATDDENAVTTHTIVRRAIECIRRLR